MTGVQTCALPIYVIIDGNLGARAGDKMRRGLILVRGKTGDVAGSRMVGGTIVAEGGFGANAGQLMRRGTLIGPSVSRMLSTFGDCGVHDLVILKVMARAWAKELGPLAPKALPQAVRRFAGDLAAIGKSSCCLRRYEAVERIKIRCCHRTVFIPVAG